MVLCRQSKNGYTDAVLPHLELASDATREEGKLASALYIPLFRVDAVYTMTLGGLLSYAVSNALQKYHLACITDQILPVKPGALLS